MIDRSGLSVDAALSFSSLCTHTPQQQQRMRILNSFSELSKRKIVFGGPTRFSSFRYRIGRFSESLNAFERISK
jgi:hypothetical protein